MTTRLEIEPGLRAPVRRGDTLGAFHVYVDGALAKEIPLIAAADIAKRTPLRMLWQWLTGE